MVLDAEKEQPFVRLVKGKVDRRSPLREYETEIESSYSKLSE